MPAFKVPFKDCLWMRLSWCLRVGYETELVEYCYYTRYYLGFFMIEFNDWS